MCHVKHWGPACKALGTQKPLTFLNNFNSEHLVQTGGTFAFKIPLEISWDYIGSDWNPLQLTNSF